MVYHIWLMYIHFLNDCMATLKLLSPFVCDTFKWLNTLYCLFCKLKKFHFFCFERHALNCLSSLRCILLFHVKYFKKRAVVHSNIHFVLYLTVTNAVGITEPIFLAQEKLELATIRVQLVYCMRVVSNHIHYARLVDTYPTWTS